MENIEVLRNIGLTDQEARVYLSSLRLGASPASLVAKDTGLKRTTVYPILKTLTTKGFVSVYYKNNQRLYLAQRPQKLSRYFEKRLETFNSIIPSLEAMDKKQAKAIGLRFIETREELEKFYTDVLISYKNKTYYIIGDTPAWETINPKFFLQYRKDRAKANIKTKLLLSAQSKDINPKDESLLREFKYLPNKHVFKSTIDIYPDQIVVLSPELSSLAVVIAVPAMVDVFKSVFEILWDMIDN
jgi:sugar-specific transcriptional regulator TrmB